MLLMNKITLSTSTFTVSTNNKRKRTPSMASITPLLQRIKKSLLLQTKPTVGTITSTTKVTSNSPRRSNTVNYSKSIDDDEKSILYNSEETKYYALRLERSMTEKKYTQPAENWWSASPPIQQNIHHSRPIMIC